MLEKLEKFQIENPQVIYGGFTATDDLWKWRKNLPS